MIPSRIGRYEIVNRLGRGAMGEVYQARDPALGREVALKLITPPDETRLVAWQRRFEREVQAAGRLNHPHIVTVFDVDLTHDPPYVVMELLTGHTLKERLQQRPLTWSEAVALLLPLAQALAFAHRAGVIHRDVKPGNVMFSGGQATSPIDSWRQNLKLVDFGLAYHQGQERVTETGGVVGTPAYMSPEQANGEVVDARTDIFALGLILVEMITGQNPQDKGSVGQTWLAATSYEPLDLSQLEGQAPNTLINIIRRILAKAREDRYHTAEVLQQDLSRCLAEVSTLVPTAVETQTIPPGQRTAEATLPIENPKGLSLPAAADAILKAMFAGYERLVIREEFGGGFSGSRVFLVRPIRAETPELPVVVKMAPLALIETEWQAYQQCIRDKMPGIAEIKGDPALPVGSRWGGLYYPLLGGGGVFEVKSLADYCRQATAEDIRYVLKQRLFKSLGPRWFFNRPHPELHLRASYDSILPINLLIEPAVLPPDTSPRLLKPGATRDHDLHRGDAVRLEGFVITEVDAAEGTVTLNLPPAESDFPPVYRLRLQGVEALDTYQLNNIIDSIEGNIVATRHDLLRTAAQAALGSQLDLSAATLSLSWPDAAPLALPNPLRRLPLLLRESRDVKVACIHGDLNLENVLVDPATREVSLIDFARARQDHVLHDLLRLEAETLTHLLPEALTEATLPAETIYSLYARLHCVVTEARTDLETLPAPLNQPALANVWQMLLTIRQQAGAYLFKPDDWSEYYQTLTIYLLGTLKFKNLDKKPTAPLPKQIAFWGAATLQHFQQQPLPCPEAAPEQFSIKRPRWPVWAGVGLVILVIIGLAFLLRPIPLENETPAAPLATIAGFEPEVEIRRIGSDRLTPATFGMPLRQGDVVNTYVAAAASIICNNGLLYTLPEQSNLVIACDDTEDARLAGRLDPTLSGQLLAISAITTPTLTLDQTRSIRGDQERLPLLLSPRNTVITDTQPRFRWQAVEGAGGYRLTVSFPDGQRWSRESSETELAYPPDAPPLAPGSANIITLTTLDDEPAEDKTLLQLLAEEAQTNLAANEAEIQALPVDEGTRTFLLAQLYQSVGLRATAIERLERLAESQTTSDSRLQQQLGDLYFDIGLYGQAETYYQTTLTAAEAANDTLAQGAAQVGLGRVAHTFDEVEQAVKHFEAAEQLYQEAGEFSLAEAVAMERAKLE